MEEWEKAILELRDDLRKTRENYKQIWWIVTAAFIFGIGINALIWFLGKFIVYLFIG